MKILVLNGSPHLEGPTSDMVAAIAKGAEEAGHEVIMLSVPCMTKSSEFSVL